MNGDARVPMCSDTLLNAANCSVYAIQLEAHTPPPTKRSGTFGIRASIEIQRPFDLEALPTSPTSSGVLLSAFGPDGRRSTVGGADSPWRALVEVDIQGNGSHLTSSILSPDYKMSGVHR